MTRIAVRGKLASDNAILEIAISAKAGSAETIEVAAPRLDDEVAAMNVLLVTGNQRRATLHSARLTGTECVRRKL